MLTSSDFWIGFASGFAFLIIVCLLCAGIFPKHIKRGAEKFDRQREAYAEKQRMKDAWKIFYSDDRNFKKTK